MCFLLVACKRVGPESYANFLDVVNLLQLLIWRSDTPSHYAPSGTMRLQQLRGNTWSLRSLPYPQIPG